MKVAGLGSKDKWESTMQSLLGKREDKMAVAGRRTQHAKWVLVSFVNYLGRGKEPQLRKR